VNLDLTIPIPNHLATTIIPAVIGTFLSFNGRKATKIGFKKVLSLLPQGFATFLKSIFFDFNVKGGLNPW